MGHSLLSLLQQGQCVWLRCDEDKSRKWDQQVATLIPGLALPSLLHKSSGLGKTNQAWERCSNIVKSLCCVCYAKLLPAVPRLCNPMDCQPGLL